MRAENVHAGGPQGGGLHAPPADGRPADPTLEAGPSGATALARWLHAAGVRVVFVLPGGHILPLMGALHQAGVRLVGVRHESAAAQMAQGWALATGQPGVALVTAGAGFTHAVTGLVDAATGRLPLVLIAGRSRSRLRGREAVQDFDQAALAQTVARATVCLDLGATEELARLPEAWTHAGGAPGPLYLQVAPDFLRAPLPAGATLGPPSPALAPPPDAAALGTASAWLGAAQRPLILCGSGAYWAGAGEPLRALAERSGIPVATTGAARGLLPDGHRDCLGGLVHAGAALQMADTVLLVGSRFNGNLLFGRGPLFPEDQRVIQVDCDPAARGFNRLAELFVEGDAAQVLTALALATPAVARPEWDRMARSAVAASHELWADEVERGPAADGVHPAALGRAVQDALGDRPATLILDGGDILGWGLGWAAAERPGSLLTTSTALGTLGVGLPFACAARLAHPDRATVVISGDGAFGLAAMELATAVRERLPMVVLVANNGSWGDLRHLEALWLDGLELEANRLGTVRYDRVARALGAEGVAVRRERDLPAAVAAALARPGPVVIDVHTDWRPQSRLMAGLGVMDIM
ncbi:MAG TPA: thiamine pyrophosphate-binding protein [Candidatus Dormibacteraeota bacterium]|nr:thiamine pyrophosphate-binding protein [Candidatus Dormibacteraeota bacterium]